MGWFQNNAPGSTFTGVASGALGGSESGPGMGNALLGAIGRPNPTQASGTIGMGGPPPGYHYEGIDWDQHLVPDDPNNPNTPGNPWGKPIGGELPPGMSKSPGMPAMGEGPGGWTGHAQDPNFGQLGQVGGGGYGNLIGANPIQGGNAMGGGMVQLRAPTGEIKAVSPDHVSRLMGLGATRVS